MVGHKIILDCDPGVDDAVAILLALASPQEIEVIGITTVAGNMPLRQTAYNARRVCTLAGCRQMPIYAGCQRPMFANTVPLVSVHGHDGLGDVAMPEPAMALRNRHAVDFIIQSILDAPGEVTLCPIGPMTNIALAIIKEPAIAGKIKKLVFMGGAAFCPGNSTPVAEFNIYADPWAAQIVLNAGIPQVMFGLDVTLQAKVDASQLQAWRHGGGDVLAHVGAMVGRYGANDPCLHDPCVVAWLIDPTLFTGVAGRISVNCQDNASRGQTLVAVKAGHLAGAAPNVDVMTRLDQPRFLALISERLSRL